MTLKEYISPWWREWGIKLFLWVLMVIADNLYDTAALSCPCWPSWGNHFPSQEGIAGQAASRPSCLVSWLYFGVCSFVWEGGLCNQETLLRLPRSKIPLLKAFSLGMFDFAVTLRVTLVWSLRIFSKLTRLSRAPSRESRSLSGEAFLSSGRSAKLVGQLEKERYVGKEQLQTCAYGCEIRKDL